MHKALFAILYFLIVVVLIGAVFCVVKFIVHMFQVRRDTKVEYGN